MRAAVTGAIPAAQRTEFAAGAWREEELTAWTRDEFSALGLSWDDFFAKARVNAAADLALLKPRYIRDRRKIIQYAALRSELPIMPSAVLAPKFLDLFAETLGPKVLVTVPNRHTAFVFPALASDYREFAPMVLEAYRATSYPVSIEIFEVSTEGLRAVGVYSER